MRLWLFCPSCQNADFAKGACVSAETETAAEQRPELAARPLAKVIISLTKMTSSSSKL